MFCRSGRPSRCKWIANLGRAVVIIAAAIPGVALAAEGPADTKRYCLDPERDIAVVHGGGICEGEVVDSAAAARAKERRVARIRAALQRKQDPSIGDRQLFHSGSGVFLATGGDVLTNVHVVTNCRTITVATAAGQQSKAKIKARHPIMDLALLTTPLQVPEVAIFRQPDTAFQPRRTDLIGYPQLGLQTERPQLAEGQPYFSPALRNDEFHLFVQAPVRAGYSGGPVLDHTGLIIGLIFAQIDTPSYYHRTGRLLRNVGVAIPTAAILPFLQDAGVAFQQLSHHDELAPAAVFKRRKGSVVRVDCWR